MPGEGFTAGVTPSDQVRSDAEYGFEIAKAISKLEIGQTVVVKEGTTLAVEGWEGTDACISRGGELSGGKGAVVVKVARLNHDMRFDIPCVGMKTLENCKGKGICAIVFEANKTLLLDQPEICSYAKKIGITLMSYPKHARNSFQRQKRLLLFQTGHLRDRGFFNRFEYLLEPPASLALGRARFSFCLSVRHRCEK